MKYVTIVALLVCSFATSSRGVRAQLIVAHRGASHEAPENTLAAFELAWEQNADAAEGDFYLTSDGKIACIHDKNTERVTANKSKLSVVGSTLAELQQLDVGSWKDTSFRDQRVPSFRQVVQTVPDDKLLFIEVKCGPEIIPTLRNALVKASVPPARARIISFHEPVIAAAKQQMPEIEAYWLTAFEYDKRIKRWSPTHREVIDRALAVDADGVDLEGNRVVVNQELVDACHDAGLSVHVWTINNPDKAFQFQALGVDSITTNRPALLRDRLFPQPQSEPSTIEPVGANTGP